MKNAICQNLSAAFVELGNVKKYQADKTILSEFCVSRDRVQTLRAAMCSFCTT